MINMEIVNITATVQMKKPFDLDTILEKVPSAEKSRIWVKVRIPPYDKYTAFYSSGKFLITGVKNFDELEEIANNVVNYLKEHGIENDIKNIKVNNHVLIDQLDYPINLNNLIFKLDPSNASYEPEQFPGLSFKDENNITYLLFNSGKITITGVKSIENLEEKVNSFKQFIYEKSIDD